MGSNTHSQQTFKQYDVELKAVGVAVQALQKNKALQKRLIHFASHE